MSAWPEAYYIINQLSNQFDLSKRVLRLEKRIIVFAKTKTGVREPDLTDIVVTPGITFTEGSLWFVEKDVESTDTEPRNPQIYALSIYSEQTGQVGWSDFHILSVDVDNISFNPTSSILITQRITDIGEAINYIADQLGTQVSIPTASQSEAGIVQIKTDGNITVQNGLISVENASISKKGVVKLTNSVTGENENLVVTQKAIKNALASKITSSDVDSKIGTAISNANFLNEITIGQQTLNKNQSTVNTGTLITDLGITAVTGKNVSTTLDNTSNLVTASAVKTVTDSLNDKVSNKILTVSNSGWSSSATEIEGVSLYSKNINNVTICDENPIIGISAPTSRTSQIPSKAETKAFSLLYAAIADKTNNRITFYATAVPETTFYVMVKGVK